MSTPTPIKGCAIVGCVLLGITCMLGGAVLYETHKVSVHSAQMALFTEIEILLEEHYQQHNRYPPSLKELPLTYPDGGDESTLEWMQYKLVDDDYVLTTASVWPGDEYRSTGKEYRAELAEWKKQSLAHFIIHAAISRLLDPLKFFLEMGQTIR